MHGMCFNPFICWAPLYKHYLLDKHLTIYSPYHVCIEMSRTGHSSGTGRASLELGIEGDLPYGCTELREEGCNSVRRSSLGSARDTGVRMLWSIRESASDAWSLEQVTRFLVHTCYPGIISNSTNFWSQMSVSGYYMITLSLEKNVKEMDDDAKKVSRDSIMGISYVKATCLHFIWRQQEASISSKLNRKIKQRSNSKASSICRMGVRGEVLLDHFLITSIHTT